MAPSVPLGSAQQVSRADLAHQPGCHGREQKKPFKIEIKSLPLECVCVCDNQRNCLNFAYSIN